RGRRRGEAAPAGARSRLTRTVPERRIAHAHSGACAIRLPDERPSGGLVGLDLEDELDLVRDEEATGLEGGVPVEAPVLAVHGRGAVEAGLRVAVRVL